MPAKKPKDPEAAFEATVRKIYKDLRAVAENLSADADSENPRALEVLVSTIVDEVLKDRPVLSLMATFLQDRGVRPRSDDPGKGYA